MRTYSVALVGATGLVGREIAKILASRRFPLHRIVAIAAPGHMHEPMHIAGHDVAVQAPQADSFAQIDLVFMSAGSQVAAKLAPQALAQGAVVIDNSACFRLAAHVPLIVPEVNAAALQQAPEAALIANPNCTTIQLCVALAPLHRAFGLTEVVVSTYQAVSGAGKAGMDELSQQVLALYQQQDATPHTFAQRIAFNCLAQIGAPHEDAETTGYTSEEQKLRAETRKILALPQLRIAATCVRVPVFNGHGASIHARFAQPVSLASARAALRQAPGVVLQDSLPTPVDVDGEDATFVGRLRVDSQQPHSLNLWCVADNLRKGAATNAVQIAELLLRQQLPQRATAQVLHA